MQDPRRHIPKTDLLLRSAQQDARVQLAPHKLKQLARNAQALAREGVLPAEEVQEVFLRSARATPSSLTPVLNATGVVVHTNIGRAPLAPAAIDALVDAAEYVDVEMDLAQGVRSRTRGSEATNALLAACPAAEDALVVNNGASALLLAAATFAEHKEMVISRGELIEIGAGFRLPELIESARVDLVEVGATNRTHLHDYERAIGRSGNVGAILKVHPSNYRVVGFTAEATIAQLRTLADTTGVTLVVDTGSGLLHPDPALPDEPDAHTALQQGADVVLFSGDKLLGGPQAGVILGKREAIARLKKHPLARAVRIDKLRLAALEATLNIARTPVMDYLHADEAVLHRRARQIAEAVGGEVVAHDGRVGGGGAPGYPLEGWAVQLPARLAPVLRSGEPVVLGRVHEGCLLIDPRCIPPEADATVVAAIQSAQRATP